MYYIVCIFKENSELTQFLFCFVWCPCMGINIRLQYNGGLLPDIMTGLDDFRFLFDMYSIPPLTGGCSEGLGAF